LLDGAPELRMRDEQRRQHLDDLVHEPNVRAVARREFDDSQDTVSEEFGQEGGAGVQVQRLEHVREHVAHLNQSAIVVVTQSVHELPDHLALLNDEIDVVWRAGGDVGEDPSGLTTRLPVRAGETRTNQLHEAVSHDDALRLLVGA
ncbi:hypothetical protein PENTCL1PPCAC_3108, partial [Pristionchus entomophagus]